MDTTLDRMNLIALDKSNWQRYRFDEIAGKVSETVAPQSTDAQIYVGLEHIDPDDIHIRRFGKPDDVSGGKLKCYPGDVIFGKRRAYQRKAAIVDFEGICSAHAFVFRANPDVIDPKLFPFFLHSDQFMHRAVDISVGGLSPTINWGDLRHQEFLLPPKAEQARLAELLWAMEEVLEREKKIQISSIVMMNSFIKEEITPLFYNKNQEFFRLDDIVEIKGRVGWKGYKKTDLRDSGPIVIGAKDIDAFNRLCLVEPTFLSRDKFEESPEIMVSKRDILIVQRGNTIGKMVHLLEDIKEVTINPSMVLLKNIKIDDNYLFAILISPFIMKTVESISSTTAIPMITQRDIKEFKIPKLSPDSMRSIGAQMFRIRSLIQNIESKISTSRALQKSLIHQIF